MVNMNWFRLMLYVQQADVLVNVISSKTLDLSRAGAVSAAFLDAAGDELQDVCISLPLSIAIIIFLFRNNNYNNKTLENIILLL